MLVVGDADSIVALAKHDDSNHQKAVLTNEKLAKRGALLIYPVTAVVEAVTHIQRALSSSASAYTTAVKFAETTQVVPVDSSIYKHAVSTYFSPRTSKKNTLFDCIVATVAERNDADAIFSFDNFYKKKGFKLTSELYK